MWNSLRARRLQWLPELGLGFFDVTASAEAAGYFPHYVQLAATDIGRALNAARVAMLLRHWPSGHGVVDIGIGAGTFVESVPECRGYDVNPDGVAWLRERGLFVDPYRELIDVACMWDVLEHLHDPTPLLANVRHLVITSLPIFRDGDHVLSSKHYKPSEHVFYFTEPGLLWFMDLHGWRCVEVNDEETRIGREDIKSYAFERVA